MIEIPYDKIQFSKFSAIDTFGKVFFFDDNVYRLIDERSKSDCELMFSGGLIAELVDKKYIPFTEICDQIKIKDMPDALILYHEKIPQTFIGEWSFSMIKSAALLILDLNTFLNLKGYELKDAHPFNVLFKGYLPFWVDIGSIAKKRNENWIAEKEFFCSFYCPLKLWSDGEFYFLNKALNDKWFPHQRFLPNLDILSSKLVKPYLGESYSHIVFETHTQKTKLIPYFKGARILIMATNKILKFLSSRKGIPLKVQHPDPNYNISPNDIYKISKPNINSEWSNYHQHYYSEQISERLKKITQYTIDLKPESVLDLAGNQGLVSNLINDLSEGKVKCISTDYDENALDIGFTSAVERKIENINFVLINCILSGQRDNTVYDRFKCDVVLALAIMHHLILGQGYDIDFILSEFKKFTKKHLIIEFMPLGLWSIDSTIEPEIPIWYNVEWFRPALELHFHIIREEKLEDNRILFITQPFT